MHARIFLEIGVDERRRVSHREVQTLRQSRRTDAVDHAEVDRLGGPAHRLGDVLTLYVENLFGNERVHVAILGEGLLQLEVAAKVGQQAQLDLRIVGGQQQPAIFRQERLADLPPHFRPDGDVLQIRLAGAEPTGRRHGLLERRMVHPARCAA